jgi:hypothetical protein
VKEKVGDGDGARPAKGQASDEAGDIAEGGKVDERVNEAESQAQQELHRGP